MFEWKSGPRFRYPAALAVLVAGVFAVVFACTSAAPTPTAITFPPTPTPIVLPPTPTPITIPPTPTPIVLPPTPTPIVIASPAEPSPSPTPIVFPPTPTPGGPTPTPVPPSPTPSSLTTVEIARQVLPSVVRISVDTGIALSTGTGIVYDDEGKILTNWHVVENAISISVTKPDGSNVTGEIFRGDPNADIALVVVNDFSDLSPPEFGDPSQLEVGERLVAIGHALGLAGPPTVSTGVVSALDRVLPNGIGGELTGLIQTDAAINSGNSGGPLVNDRGEVIGINTAKLSSGDRIGFAINIDSAMETAEELIDLGAIPPPGFLGIAGTTLTQPEAANLGLPVSGGYLVQVVGEGTPAEDAGMLAGDVIVQMASTPIRSEADFTEFLQVNPAGSEIRIFAWRLVQGSGWEPVELDATLSTRP